MATHVVPLERRILPHEFLCPITLAVMRYPTRVRPASHDDDDAVAPHRSPRPSTFEYRAIAQWRAHCRRTGRPFCDPLTNLVLDAHLEPDRRRQAVIHAYMRGLVDDDARGRLRRHLSSPPSSDRGLPYASPSAALAAELHMLGVARDHVVAMLDCAAQHAHAVRRIVRRFGLRGEGGVERAPHRVWCFQYAQWRTRWKVRAVDAHSMSLGEVRLRYHARDRVVTVQCLTGRGDAPLLAFALWLLDPSPITLDVRSVGSDRVARLRTVGLVATHVSRAHILDVLARFNLECGVGYARVPWRTSPYWPHLPRVQTRPIWGSQSHAIDR